MERVTFANGPVEMAGELHLPEGFDRAARYPAVVTVHPGGGVKEQTAGRYAARMAEQGYVALAFDASHQGASGGEPRHLEDPAARVEDVRAAVDHLQGLDFVHADRIGVLGVCAGGGYAVSAATTDHRIRAVAVVSCVNIGSAYRRGWYGADADAAAVPTLGAAAGQRTAEAAGAEPVHIPYVPERPDEDTPRDLAEAHEYYLTSRAQHPNAPNKKLFARSIPRILAFDAFHLAEDLLTAPALMVAGSEAGSLWHSTELHGRLRGPKELVVVDGAAHMDFYDVPRHMERAVSETTVFFSRHLAPAA